MNITSTLPPAGRPTRPTRKGTAVALGVFLGLIWLLVLGWWVLLPLLTGDGAAVPVEDGESKAAPAPASSAVTTVGTVMEASAAAVLDVPDGAPPSGSAQQQVPEMPDRPVVQIMHGSDWIIASWHGIGEVDSWEVVGPEGWQALPANGSFIHSMGWDALQPGAQVEIRVRAVNAAGRSEWAVAEVSLPGMAAVPAEAADSPLEEERGGLPPHSPPYAAALDGTFVAVLVSAESEVAAERARTRLENELGRPFGVLLSDDFASLNPGYWVVYAGPYETARETQTVCWWELNRRSGAECYGRELSQDPSDRDNVYGPSPD